MFPHEINIDIIISGELFLVGYKDESKNIELYQKMIFWVGTKTKKLQKLLCMSLMK